MLGFAFNLASYSLLTCLLAHHCRLQRGSIVISITDCHIYLNHIEYLDTILNREVKPFPTLDILCSSETDIWDINYEDIQLNNYIAHKTIKMPMAI